MQALDPLDYQPHHAHEIRDILAGSRRTTCILYERYFGGPTEGLSMLEMSARLYQKADEIEAIFK